MSRLSPVKQACASHAEPAEHGISMVKPAGLPLLGLLLYHVEQTFNISIYGDGSFSNIKQNW